MQERRLTHHNDAPIYASAIRNRSFDADTRRLLAGKYPRELATAFVHASALDLEGTRLSLRAMSWPYAGHWHAQLPLGHSLVAHVSGAASGEWAHVIKTPLKTINGFAWTLIRRASEFQGELVATAHGPETADANASRQCAAELQDAPHNRSLGLRRDGHRRRDGHATRWVRRSRAGRRRAPRVARQNHAPSSGPSRPPRVPASQVGSTSTAPRAVTLRTSAAPTARGK